ncbi:unnamed protein product [Meloidogyne enterolobii]|uniref:Uncharacterized protein n=1 Tax=Meloidogyne enterolobii TaxID=390850 RepID=A0ACB1ATS7_MELEN
MEESEIEGGHNEGNDDDSGDEGGDEKESDEESDEDDQDGHHNTPPWRHPYSSFPRPEGGETVLTELLLIFSDS